MPKMSRRQFLSKAMLATGGILAPGASAAPARRQVRLSLNENPFGPSPRAIAAIEAHLAGLCRYAADEADALTQAIAARENIPAEHIVLGEILDTLGLYLAAAGGTGGEFIYSEPGYMALVDAVAPAGGKVIGVPLNNRLQNDLPAIAARVNARTRAVYLINPHNPSGTVNDAAIFIEAVRRMSKQTLVIVDEAYLDFDPDFDKRSVIALARDGEQVVVFRTFSKIYGLANLAIGYVVAPLELAASLRRAGVGTYLALNGLALAAATESLADTGYIASVGARIAAEREAWHGLLQRLKRPHSDSHGNFVFFDAGRPHAEVADALAKKGIEIARVFPPYENWVRISIGLPEENAYVRHAVEELLG